MKSAARTLRKSSPPIEPRRGEAPITATEAGSKNGSERRDHGLVVAALDALAIALGRSDREGQLDLAASYVTRDREADGLEDAEHLPVVRKHLRDEALDAELAARAASCSSSRVPIPLRW